MNTLMQSEIFFFISSIGFIIVWILIAVCLIYIIRSMHTFSRIIRKVEENIDELGDSAKEMLEEIKDHPIYRLIFGNGKRKIKK